MADNTKQSYSYGFLEIFSFNKSKKKPEKTIDDHLVSFLKEFLKIKKQSDSIEEVLMTKVVEYNGKKYEVKVNIELNEQDN
jgi:hypothetical protein